VVGGVDGGRGEGDAGGRHAPGWLPAARRRASSAWAAADSACSLTTWATIHKTQRAEKAISDRELGSRCGLRLQPHHLAKRSGDTQQAETSISDKYWGADQAS